MDGNGETPADEEVPVREAAVEEAPGGTAVVALDRTTDAVPPEEPLMPVERPPFSVNDSSQQPLALYNVTSQMTVIDLNPSISSAMLPKIRKMMTSLELNPHEDNRMASPKIKKELTKAGLE